MNAFFVNLCTLFGYLFHMNTVT